MDPIKENAASVKGSLEVIEYGNFAVLDDGPRKKLGAALATVILNDLPEKVVKYTHSSDLPFITAERETTEEGQEEWDCEKATEWMKSILGPDNERRSEFSLR